MSFKGNSAVCEEIQRKIKQDEQRAAAARQKVRDCTERAKKANPRQDTPAYREACMAERP